jgi:prepilin-type N-terminal cleavage/methylation domain-containing protein
MTQHFIRSPFPRGKGLGVRFFSVSSPCKGEDEGEGPMTAGYHARDSRFRLFSDSCPSRSGRGRASSAGEGPNSRMPSSPLRAPSGFTLIEMMLAIGVLALILTMLASSFSTIAHSKVHAEARLYVDREGRSLLWQMTNELRNAVQTPYALSDVGLYGNGHMGNGAAIDTITMSTFSGGHRRAITAMTPETIVTYNLTPNPDLPGCYLLTRSQQSGLLTTTTQQQSTVLADNIVMLHIRYFDGEKWGESWDSSSLPRGRQLPVAVALQFEMLAPGGHIMDFATQVTLPMAIQEW